ncbi:defensin-like protein [Nicotiana tomentosiformis]|uniref:defensin-like protein n=1 Tax=Nicotiana tomentosiformis TaxID=4098 RepID=UPI00051AB125|nr:defensin-like protein isoform X2 [Nicotiana tomentosiformis]
MMRLLSTVFLLLMVVFATEMGPVMVAEARNCESQSERFKGVCVSNRNCASVCNTEGFPDGKCKGLRRRCFCLRNC